MRKILLVEDNDSNRDLISRYLTLFGFEIVQAEDGLQGLQRAYEEGIDLILLDMNLPLLDGWEVARQLKADETVKHVPIVALTAHAMVGDREKAMAAGCNDYETKPVDFDRLMKKIETLTGLEQLT